MIVSEAVKILVADDNPTDLLLLTTMLKKQGHHVMVANDGVEAIEMFRQETPDIVLLDALMPRLDGFATAAQIKDLSGENFIPVIFLTSLQEVDSLVHCLESGGDDFLSKPYNHILLQSKINSFIRMRNMHQVVQQQRDQIAEYNQYLLKEQEVAKRVFDQVAHVGCLDADNIKSLLSPMAVFNGDVALAGVTPSGNLMVLLGDFTGHGLAAAIGAMPMAQTFYSMIDKGFVLRDIVKEMNSKLHEILPVGVFCCALIVDLDFREGAIQVWNGGLPDGLIYTSERKMVPLVSRHVPLGILPPQEFNDHIEVVAVAPGDKLFLWSDGIYEAQNCAGDMYGKERLLRVFAENSDIEQLFDEIIAAVNGFVGDGEPSDDISIIEVTVVKAAPFEVDTTQFEASSDNSRRDWTTSYQLRPDDLRGSDPLPLMLYTLMEMSPLRAHRGKLYTVLSELYSNALEHGVLGLSSELKYSADGFDQYYQQRDQRLKALQQGYVKFELSYRGDSEVGTLTIDVEDTGKGFDYSNLDFEILKEKDYSGRGLKLLLALCDSVEFIGNGNHIRVAIDHFP